MKKATPFLPLFLVIGALAIMLFLQAKQQDIWPNRIKTENTTNGENIQITKTMTGDETLDFYVQRYQSDEQIANQLLGTKVEALSNDSTRVISIKLEVTENYFPYLDIYCHVDGDDLDWSVLSIYSIQLCRKDGRRMKQFAGNIEVYLRSNHEIEYIINGDFFNSGKTEIDNGGNVNICVGDGKSICFTLTEGKQNEKGTYCYQYGTVDLTEGEISNACPN